MSGQMRGGGLRIASAALLLCIFAFALRAHAAGKELLINADLSKGSENQPDDWQTQAWVNDQVSVAFTWTHPPGGGPGEAEVNAIKENDARWWQQMELKEGWYYISADIRTENVGMDHSGATISVLEDGIMSPEVKGTSPWTHEGFYLKVGKKGADAQIALRIGGFGSLNTGKAFFRNASVTMIDAPPQGAQPIYDLDAIRKTAQPVPLGQPYSLVLTYLVLIAIAYGGWRLYAIEPPKVTRAEARREAKSEARREGKKKAARR